MILLLLILAAVVSAVYVARRRRPRRPAAEPWTVDYDAATMPSRLRDPQTGRVEGGGL